MKKIALLALMLSCSSTPKTPTAVDACTVLCALGCEVGCEGLCPSTLDMLARDRIVALDLACITRADTRAEVNRCGGVGCY